MGYIYILKNKINNKLYVGQTIQHIKKRLWQHISDTKRSNRPKSIIQNAILKYGIDGFEVKCFVVPNTLLDFFEIEMIRKLSTKKPAGYNIENGGNLGKWYPKEHRKRLSDAAKERYKKEVHPWVGRKHKKESLEKLSKAQKGNKYCVGRKYSKETINKMSETRKRNGYSKGKNNPKARKVYCVSTNEHFDTIKDAAEKYNLCASHISAVCRGKLKTTGKKVFIYGK